MSIAVPAAPTGTDASWPRPARLLLRHPLLWRSRLHVLVPVALVVAAAVWWWGLRYTMRPTDIWTASQLDSATLLLDGAMAVLAGGWWWSQARFPVGEVGSRRLATIGLLNLIGLLLLLLPGLALKQSLGWQVARVLPPTELARHLALLEPYDYWWCTDKLDAQAMSRLPELAAQLRIFGLQPGPTVSELPGGCNEVVVYTSVKFLRDPLGEPVNLELRQRLRHVQQQQVRRLGLEDMSWGSSGWAGRVVVALAGALLAVALTIPRQVWVRRLVWSEVQDGRLHLNVQPWRPAWLRRLDERLLLKRPMAWATRAHVFLFDLATMGALLLLVVVTVARWMLGDMPDPVRAAQDVLGKLGGVLLWVGGLATAGLVWWFGRRHWRIPAVTSRELLRLCGRLLLVLLPLPLLGYMALRLALDADRDFVRALQDATILASMATMQLMALVLLDNFGRGREVPLFVGIGFALTWLPFASLSIKSDSNLGKVILGVVVVVLLVSLLAVSVRSVMNDRHPHFRRVCAFAVGGAPALGLNAFLLCAMLDNHLGDRDAAWILFVVTLLLPLLLVAPLRGLSRSSQAPADE